MRPVILVLLGLLAAGCERPRDIQAEDRAVQAELIAIRAQRDAMHAWRVNSEVSPITDKTNVEITKHTQLTASVDRDIGPRLVIRCHDGETNVVFDPDAYLAEDQIDVAYRLDDGPIFKERLRSSADNMAVGWWSSTSARVIARKLAGARKFAIRVQPYSQLPQDYVFMMDDLANKLPHVASACGWIYENSNTVSAGASEASPAKSLVANPS
jgi:hypothetical protein